MFIQHFTRLCMKLTNRHEKSSQKITFYGFVLISVYKGVNVTLYIWSEVSGYFSSILDFQFYYKFVAIELVTSWLLQMSCSKYPLPNIL